ncbi:MAG: hypothetical protein GTO45_30005 [Candidatus Aminicenantes bacterium]|nr:hypothetical protein [Candidatus Aminicenantes bacterium]NIM83018.1 hypothetical protein [Candidatus Aminicenantes bacterium]NIN22405.1 hypothetical protein [Candidatus Aminicenantes bacterium]NIN46173.1 hypothetical protein [Candidatus Aminicenantes bacterium]NIN89010.1 hypothetical protein [Candidatus Aminicenantes bacterium]
MMKTKKFNALRLSKTTIANLNTNEIRNIYGGGFEQDPGAEIPAQPIPPIISTETCSGCTTTVNQTLLT